MRNRWYRSVVGGWSIPSAVVICSMAVINAAIKLMFAGRCERSDYVKTIVATSRASLVTTNRNVRPSVVVVVVVASFDRGVRQASPPHVIAHCLLTSGDKNLHRRRRRDIWCQRGDTGRPTLDRMLIQLGEDVYDCPAHVVQWSNHLGAMCSRAWRSQWPRIDSSLGPGPSAY